MVSARTRSLGRGRRPCWRGRGRVLGECRLDRSGAEHPAERPPHAALRSAIIAESRCARADSTEYRPGPVEILVALRPELPRLVMDTSGAGEPAAQPRVHGGI